ncbi:hypothetical protein HJG60_008668 [Phyllostomus discolor]|uniref:Uncharacterized protein n=1 Tax=Phyllostomus discolor TaxID=89673 RepID=A0A833Z542_9CHIR|nr:hypothetical protein HJG60_008668 [Phyllostomus discolor]
MLSFPQLTRSRTGSESLNETAYKETSFTVSSSMETRGMFLRHPINVTAAEERGTEQRYSRTCCTSRPRCPAHQAVRLPGLPGPGPRSIIPTAGLHSLMAVALLPPCLRTRTPPGGQPHHCLSSGEN